MIPSYVKHLALLTLMAIMLMQEVRWLAFRDAMDMLLLALEAFIASTLLDSLLGELDPNLPALPLPHFISTSTYTIESAFIIAKNLVTAAQPTELLHAVLLATILATPLVRHSFGK